MGGLEKFTWQCINQQTNHLSLKKPEILIQKL